MSNLDKKKNLVEWYDNPNIITNYLILMIALILILSQSFAVSNGLGVAAILSGILNHNVSYLLVCIYFVALKIKVGKRYFDFLNIFMIILYTLISVASLLSLLQSFGLGSLLGFGIDLMMLIYMIHTFLRSTIIWKSMNLNKSPFNEVSNNGYFYSVLILSITLLAVNLIATTSFNGTILALMDTGYTILFARYIFLYGEFLNSKKISINNDGNFEQITDIVKDKVNEFVEENELNEKIDNLEEKVVIFTNDVKEKVSDIKESIEEKVEKINIDEKIDTAKKKVSELVEEVTEDVNNFVKEAKVEEKVKLTKAKVAEFVDDVKNDAKSLVDNNIEKEQSKKFFSRKKSSKQKSINSDTKKGNK